MYEAEVTADMLLITGPSNSAMPVETKSSPEALLVNAVLAGNRESFARLYELYAPMVHGIWVQLQFKDGEIMEGIVLNGMHHLVEPGFFVHPTDPDANNSLIYVLKTALADFRVLGVRSL